MTNMNFDKPARLCLREEDGFGCAGLGGGFGVTGLVDQMRGNGAIDDAQYLAHDGRLAGEQKASRRGRPLYGNGCR